MKLHVASDIHLEFGGQETNYVGYTGLTHVPGTDVLILAGDIGVGDGAVPFRFEAWPTPILYVAGNHEYYGHDIVKVNAGLREKCAGTHIRFLERDAVVIDGVRFLGTTLWTDYLLYGKEKQAAAIHEARECMADHSRIRVSGKRFDPKDAMFRFARSKQWLREQLAVPFEGKTVVITHHGPHWESVHPKYRTGTDVISAAFASDLTEFMGEAALWVHGHGHDSFDYEIKGTRVISNPRGYPNRRSGMFENVEWNDHLVVEI